MTGMEKRFHMGKNMGKKKTVLWIAFCSLLMVLFFYEEAAASEATLTDNGFDYSKQVSWKDGIKTVHVELDVSSAADEESLREQGFTIVENNGRKIATKDCDQTERTFTLTQIPNTLRGIQTIPLNDEYGFNAMLAEIMTACNCRESYFQDSRIYTDENLQLVEMRSMFDYLNGSRSEITKVNWQTALSSTATLMKNNKYAFLGYFDIEKTQEGYLYRISMYQSPYYIEKIETITGTRPRTYMVLTQNKYRDTEIYVDVWKDSDEKWYCYDNQFTHIMNNNYKSVDGNEPVCDEILSIDYYKPGEDDTAQNNDTKPQDQQNGNSNNNPGVTGNTGNSDQPGQTNDNLAPEGKNDKTINVTKKNIKYRIQNGEATLLKANKKLNKAKPCVIPDTVSVGGNEYPVTAIEPKAFANMGKITQITIGKNVKKIGKMAFYKCKKMKLISINTRNLTAKKIGANAFKGTPKKITIEVPTGKDKDYKKILEKRGVSKKALYHMEVPVYSF